MFSTPGIPLILAAFSLVSLTMVVAASQPTVLADGQ